MAEPFTHAPLGEPDTHRPKRKPRSSGDSDSSEELKKTEYRPPAVKARYAAAQGLILAKGQPPTSSRARALTPSVTTGARAAKVPRPTPAPTPVPSDQPRATPPASRPATPTIAAPKPSSRAAGTDGPGAVPRGRTRTPPPPAAPSEPVPTQRSGRRQLTDDERRNPPRARASDSTREFSSYTWSSRAASGSSGASGSDGRRWQDSRNHPSRDRSTGGTWGPTPPPWAPPPEAIAPWRRGDQREERDDRDERGRDNRDRPRHRSRR